MGPPSPDAWRAVGDTFEWRGHRIFFRAEGAGDPVLLVHGFPTASWDWWALWPLLDRYRLLTLDMLGFGFSAKPRIAYSILAQADLYTHFLARQGVTAYRLIAHDYGDTVQHPEYIAKQLADFKSGRRKGTMNEQAQTLSEADMKALGAFFGRIKPKAHRVADPDLAAVGRYIYHKGNPFSGVASCESCHGPKGEGTVQLPRLAGQHAAYLQSQLKDFNARARTNDNAVMHAIASKLTELEIRAVTVYLSGQL